MLVPCGVHITAVKCRIVCLQDIKHESILISFSKLNINIRRWGLFAASKRGDFSNMHLFPGGKVTDALVVLVRGSAGSDGNARAGFFSFSLLRIPPPSAFRTPCYLMYRCMNLIKAPMNVCLVVKHLSERSRNFDTAPNKVVSWSFMQEVDLCSLQRSRSPSLQRVQEDAEYVYLQSIKLDQLAFNNQSINSGFGINLFFFFVCL